MSEEGARVQRLSIRTTHEHCAFVHCPQQRHDIDVLKCQSCGHCIGLSARDSYLVCTWHERDIKSTEGHSHPMKATDSAPAPQITTILPGLSRFERQVVTATLDETAFDVACRMRDKHVGCVVVVREGRPVGMLTDRDIVLRVVAEGLDARSALVSSIVTYEAATVTRADGFETAARTMREHGVRRVPIVDENGCITGIVTADDLIALLGRELSALGEAITSNVDGSESR